MQSNTPTLQHIAPSGRLSFSLCTNCWGRLCIKCVIVVEDVPVVLLSCIASAGKMWCHKERGDHLRLVMMSIQCAYPISAAGLSHRINLPTNRSSSNMSATSTHILVSGHALWDAGNVPEAWKPYGLPAVGSLTVTLTQKCNQAWFASRFNIPPQYPQTYWLPHQPDSNNSPLRGQRREINTSCRVANNSRVPVTFIQEELKSVLG